MSIIDERPAARIGDGLADALARVFGYDAFRPGQREAIEGVLSGRDALVVVPTGGGKSLCYQLPAALDRGLVLCVSPLIALMDDQVASAREVGIRAAALHSGLDAEARGRAHRALASGELQLLYASPERLVQSDLARALGGRLALVAIDEAHCVSHWGHDFRPEYRQLAAALDAGPRVPRLALTATATPAVRRDIEEQLGLSAPLRFVGHPDRANLTYRAAARTDAAKQVLEVVRRHDGEGGIVYAQTRREVQRIADRLASAGVRAAAYHAGLAAGERARVQTAFLSEALDVVVATIAFGMGIDRSDVRFVVHANAPKSVEHYQQESGRAGRDGLPAECVLLFSAADIVAHRRLSAMDGPLEPERARALDDQLTRIARFAQAPVCRHRLLSEHFGAAWPPPGTGPEDAGGCAACDVCLGETVELDASEADKVAKMVLSAVYRTGASFGAGHVAKVLLGATDERVRRLGHDRLSVFGLLESAGRRAVRTWIDQLIVQGHLEVEDRSGFPVPVIGERGAALLRGRGSVRLSRVAARAPRARRAKGEAFAGLDEGLVERLRALRRLLAERIGAPPYIVFGDATLAELVRARPQTERALLGVKGIGEAKLARYGPSLLALLGGSSPEEAAGLLTPDG